MLLSFNLNGELLRAIAKIFPSEKKDVSCLFLQLLIAEERCVNFGNWPALEAGMEIGNPSRASK